MERGEEDEWGEMIILCAFASVRPSGWPAGPAHLHAQPERVERGGCFKAGPRWGGTNRTCTLIPGGQRGTEDCGRGGAEGLLIGLDSRANGSQPYWHALKDSHHPQLQIKENGMGGVVGVGRGAELQQIVTCHCFQRNAVLSLPHHHHLPPPPSPQLRYG